MTIGRLERFTNILTQLEANVPGVEATAIFDMDGLVIASRLPTYVDEEIIGAMSAAILSIGNRSGKELECGFVRAMYPLSPSAAKIRLGSVPVFLVFNPDGGFPSA